MTSTFKFGKHLYPFNIIFILLALIMTSENFKIFILLHLQVNNLSKFNSTCLNFNSYIYYVSDIFIICILLFSEYCERLA